LAFDQSEKFGFTKQAAEPCRHLSAKHSCNIHNDLTPKGFAGCVRYNCFGAGQRVFTEIFDSKSWRDHPDEAQTMFDAYRVMHNVHEHLAMLNAAKKLPIDDAQARQIQRFEHELSPKTPWTPASLADFQRAGTFEEIKAFFSGLRDRV
jgi:hypothetical protein